jgi:hypothetical protein
LVATIVFNEKEIAVHTSEKTRESTIQSLLEKMEELEYNFSDFRKKVKSISSIELVDDVAILYYVDGTEVYIQYSSMIH